MHQCCSQCVPACAKVTGHRWFILDAKAAETHALRAQKAHQNFQSRSWLFDLIVLTNHNQATLDCARWELHLAALAHPDKSRKQATYVPCLSQTSGTDALNFPLR